MSPYGFLAKTPNGLAANAAEAMFMVIVTEGCGYEGAPEVRPVATRPPARRLRVTTSQEDCDGAVLVDQHVVRQDLAEAGAELLLHQPQGPKKMRAAPPITWWRLDGQFGRLRHG